MSTLDDLIFGGGFGGGYTTGKNGGTWQDPFNLPKKTTPNPNMLGTLDSFLNRPGGSMLMNLLAQSGYGYTPSSPFGVIGRAGLMTQQQGQQREQFDLNRQLIESQIGLNEARVSGGGPT